MLSHKGTQPIETSRLILRRAVREDAEAMFRNWASDPKVTKYLTWPTYEKVETAHQILDLWTSEYEKPDYYQWMIVLKEFGEPIGSISVFARMTVWKKLRLATASIVLGGIEVL